MKPYSAPVLTDIGTISDLTRDKNNGPSDGFSVQGFGGSDPSVPPFNVCDKIPELCAR